MLCWRNHTAHSQTCVFPDVSPTGVVGQKGKMKILLRSEVKRHTPGVGLVQYTGQCTVLAWLGVFSGPGCAGEAWYLRIGVQPDTGSRLYVGYARTGPEIGAVRSRNMDGTDLLLYFYQMSGRSEGRRRRGEGGEWRWSLEARILSSQDSPMMWWWREKRRFLCDVLVTAGVGLDSWRSRLETGVRVADHMRSRGRGRGKGRGADGGLATQGRSNVTEILRG